MKISELLQLRPKVNTAAAIREAITGAANAHAEARAKAETLQRDRSRLLACGNVADVAAAEQELMEARAEAERAEALALGLRDRLAAAEAAEAEAATRAAIKRAAEQRAAFVAFATGPYVVLARKIAAGLALEFAAYAAVEKAAGLFNALPAEVAERLAAEGIVPPGMPAAGVHESFANGGFGGYVQLPSPESAPGYGAAALWP